MSSSQQVVKGNGKHRAAEWVVNNLPTLSRKAPWLVGKKNYHAIMGQKIAIMLQGDKHELFAHLQKWPEDIVHLGKMIVDPEFKLGNEAAEFLLSFSGRLNILPIASMLHANWDKKDGVSHFRKGRILPALSAAFSNGQADALSRDFPGIETKVNKYRKTGVPS